MKKIGLILALAIATSACTQSSDETNISTTPTQSPSTKLVQGNIKDGHAGFFEVNGKKADTKFVRVIYVAEGSEKEGESDSTDQVIYTSKDLAGNHIKAHRFQIVTKSTGYDALQKDQKKGDYKIKKVLDGAKFSIEVPLNEKGERQLDKAVVGSLAYAFDAGKIKAKFTKPEQVESIKLNITALQLPPITSKPGDKGMVYEAGYINAELIAKVKNPDTGKIETINIKIDDKISLTHARGKEKDDKATSIDPLIVKKNIK